MEMKKRNLNDLQRERKHEKELKKTHDELYSILVEKKRRIENAIESKTRFINIEMEVKESPNQKGYILRQKEYEKRK